MGLEVSTTTFTFPGVLTSFDVSQIDLVVNTRVPTPSSSTNSSSTPFIFAHGQYARHERNPAEQISTTTVTDPEIPTSFPVLQSAHAVNATAPTSSFPNTSPPTHQTGKEIKREESSSTPTNTTVTSTGDSRSPTISSRDDTTTTITTSPTPTPTTLLTTAMTTSPTLPDPSSLPPPSFYTTLPRPSPPTTSPSTTPTPFLEAIYDYEAGFHDAQAAVEADIIGLSVGLFITVVLAVVLGVLLWKMGRRKKRACRQSAILSDRMLQDGVDARIKALEEEVRVLERGM
ncbi:hypothetical protein CC80DRAFT_541736 [Byssothecium circinans]|uniref:Uncharacterized protein n=1 Tax=Byssothecium circinans TaxID=147558 RepID=A0A6A5UGQ6_9PLEO|nr:hypothetical protein CC80DRAFT_541736 [Byssothecium circinans]